MCVYVYMETCLHSNITDATPSLGVNRFLRDGLVFKRFYQAGHKQINVCMNVLMYACMHACVHV